MHVRQLLAVTAACAIVATAGVAQAAPTQPATALAAVQAMTSQAGLVTSASYVVQPTVGVAGPTAPTVAISSDPVLGMPDHGSSYAILSSGDAISDMSFTGARVDGIYTNGTGTAAHSSSPTDINDLTVLKATITVPAGANCLSFDFRFLSQEYPQYVGSFNDGLIVELDRNDWTSNGTTFTAPGNFAFDASGKPISINSTGSLGMSEAGAAGTGFASTSSDSAGGGTGLLTAQTPVTPGSHDVYFSVFDQGDHKYDTGALIDNLATASVAGGCAAGAAVPPSPPLAPTITAQPSATPSATGIFTFVPATGDTSAASYECSIDGGPFAACASGDDVDTGLSDGTHSFSVRADNASGQSGPVTGPVSWTIARTPPPAPKVSGAPPAAPAVTGAPPAKTGSTTADIAFSGEPGATFACALDGGIFVTCTSPASFAGLRAGKHELVIHQTDMNGTTSADRTIDWTITQTFLVQVRYRIPEGCAGTCKGSATLAALVGKSGARTLGRRAGISLPRGTWARFTITISKAALLASPGSTTKGIRTSGTRLTVVVTRPKGARVTTEHEGHVSVSVERLRSGKDPALGATAAR